MTEQFARNLVTIREQAARAGRVEAPFEPMSFVFTVFDDSYEAAHKRAATMLERIYRVPFEDAARKYCLLGRPEDMLEQLAAFAEVGSRHFVFSMLSDGDEFRDAFAKDIRPQLSGLALG